MEVKKALILGGNGFLGRRLRAELESTGCQTWVASRTTGDDLLDYHSALKVVDRHRSVDAIFNCAAHVGSVHYVRENAAVVFSENTQMALNLYRAAGERGLRCPIVNPLSNCSYPGEAEVQSEADWWSGPVHDSVMSYGNAKRFIYVLSRCYQEQHGLRSVNLLVPNSFGPGDYLDPNRTHALNGMIIRMLKARWTNDQEFKIWGTGRPVREWGYIDDVARILSLSVMRAEAGIEPVNIAQQKGFSIRESAEAIASVIGFKGVLSFDSSFGDGAPIKVLGDETFRTVFPDFEFTDHVEGIRRTVAYYEEALLKSEKV